MVQEKTKSLKLKTVVAVISCLIAIATFSSCVERDAYFRYNELKEGQWSMRDTLFFTIDSTDYNVDMPYDVFIEITNNVNYPYQNIWFFEWDNLTNDSTFTRTEIECPLADEFGKWTGTGFGSLLQSTIPLKENVIFRDKRNISIKVLHGMQDDVLNGIEKVGIRLSSKK